MRVLQGAAATEGGRLLRVLLIRLGEMPSGAGAEGVLLIVLSALIVKRGNIVK